MTRNPRSNGNPKLRFAILLAPLLAASGCHSPYIAANVINHTGETLRLLELDYPSASFGIDQLAAGATFKYRFKILGSGPTKLSWTDAHQKQHLSNGPNLQQGQEGSLTVSIDPAGHAAWTASLRN